MVDNMSRAHRWLPWAVVALAPAVTGAQTLVDPTRPPAGLSGGQGDAGVVGGAPVLQSVMISSSGRAAIISGEVVRLGERFGAARLVKISENEVVLKEGSEEQILRLYPGVSKNSVATGGAAAAAKRTRAGAGESGVAGSRSGGGMR